MATSTPAVRAAAPSTMATATAKLIAPDFIPAVGRSGGADDSA
jgi:hypothetical protein